jgi:hypothetical protein
MALAMQYEVTISAYDVSSMLSYLARSTRKVDVSLVNGTILERCTVVSCDEYMLVVITPSPGLETYVPIASIKAIEFEGFHEYRGLCSKIFVLE